MRSSRRMLRQVRRALFVAFAFSGCINILMLATPLYILQVFETVVPLSSIETLFVLTAIAAGAILTLALVELARDRILLRAGLWLDHELGQYVLDNGLKAGTDPNELKADQRALEQFRAFLTSSAITPLFDAPWVPIFLVVLFLLHPLIGMVAIGAAITLLIAALMQTWLAGRLQRDISGAHERAEHWWMTVVGSGSLFGALGLGPGATNQWERFNRAQIAGSYSLGKRSGLIKVFSRTVRIGSQIALYGLGAFLVINAELTPGALVASAILLARALGPLEQMVSAIRAIRMGLGAYRHLKGLPADVMVPRVQSGEFGPVGHLVMSDVTFYYPSRKTPALRGVSLELAPGECLGVVGPNGSGKSTLAALMAGALQPSNGAANLDQIPVYKWQRCTDVMPPVGYLPDEPALIEGSVHDNIARFRDATVMSVVEAATSAGVHDTLAALPQGYDTQVGAAGSQLSMRERRAVALARAVHGAPRLIVLDEPEIGLDGGSLRALARVLGELKENGTALVVATQDPRLLALTDKVALISQGALKSLGPSSDLNKRFEAARAADKTPVPAMKPPPVPEPVELH